MRAGHPVPQGLYDGRHEHDACGVAFVATMSGVASYDIVAKALVALRNLEHRGAAGSDPASGDGAGILTQVPDAFLRAVVDFELPEQGSYAVGIAFLPHDEGLRAVAESTIAEIAAEEGLTILGWRDVPVTPDLLGGSSGATCPVFRQLFVASAGDAPAQAFSAGASDSGVDGAEGVDDGLALERQAFCLRKRAEGQADVYFASLSSRTLVYKGMLTTGQLEPFYPDLSDRRFHTRDRPGALTVLDQHVPVVGAVAPVPVHRAQRRDQHRHGQPQLDARPRVPARHGPDPRRPRPAVPDLHARARATPRASTRCSSCCTSAAGRCRTRC